MSKLVLDTATKRRVVERLAWTLKKFHEAEERKAFGFESVSWRGQLGGFREALGIIVGSKARDEILDTVSRQTELGFPHRGPVTDDGSIYNLDLEAQPRL